MAKITHTPKTGYIKVVEWSAVDGCNDPDLEACLRRVLDKLPNNKDRTWRNNPADPMSRFIEDLATYDECLVGTLRQFQREKKMEVIRIHESDPKKPMEVAKASIPAAEDGEPQEHCEHTLCFLVSGDRVGFVQAGPLTLRPSFL